MNHKIAKIGVATALSLVGITSITSLKTVSAATYKTAIKRVRINYLPGKGVKIWTNYNSGRFMGFRAKDKTEWNVVKTAVDKNGALWYMVGDNEWIEARYTIDLDEETETAQTQTVDKSASQTANTSKKSVTQKVKEKVTTAAKTTAKKKQIQKAKQIVDQTISKANKTKTTTTTTNKPSTQAPSGAVSTIVNLSKQQVGKNYVWGGSGPDTFDCSGLVQYVYAKAGVNLPRTTYDQIKVGQTVSLDSLQPGDLVFWGSTTAPYHVAIYVGNNQYVNAATPDQGVILQTLSSYYTPSIAKRVL